MATNYIQAYPDASSIFPDSTLVFHVSTQSPQFRIEFYRQGSYLELMAQSSLYPGQYLPSNSPDIDWGWPSYNFDIPADWQSGVYIAMLFQVDDNGEDLFRPDTNTTYDTESKFLFVLKNPYPGYNTSLLYKLPLFTYFAYNLALASDACLYTGAAKVTLHKPGGGTGGIPWDSGLDGNPSHDFHDEYDNDSPRQTFEHWDCKFIKWLEGNGYSPDYCTDLDIHQDDGSILNSYSLLLSAGHDEYWSEVMRDKVEDFVSHGGNIAFFSGNTCWWKVTLEDNDSTFSCDKSIHDGDNVCFDQWCRTRPENYLTGTSYRNGGGRWSLGGREKVGYKVQYAGHWIYNETGLNDGDVFGEDDSLVGYECDGIDYAMDTNFLPTTADGAPSNLLVLGYCLLDESWNDFKNNNYTPPSAGMNSIMGVYQNNGTVFNAATTDWARVLYSNNNAVERITRNVIDRLGGGPKGLSYLSDVKNIICCDGFFSDDDDFRHAIVATDDGSISEIFFNPNIGQGQTVLTVQNGIIDLGAFYTADDQQRHAIILTNDSFISEIFYNPNTGLGIAPLGNIANASRICGFYSSDDNCRHAIVSTEDGIIYELFYGVQGQGQSQIGAFDDIVDIGCFFSDDDNYRHVVVGTGDGNITEIYYHPAYGISQTLIGNVPGLIKISSFYIPTDNFFNRRIQVLDSSSRLYEFRYSSSPV